jgi:hypothetical protein
MFSAPDPLFNQSNARAFAFIDAQIWSFQHALFEVSAGRRFAKHRATFTLNSWHSRFPPEDQSVPARLGPAGRPDAGQEVQPGAAIRLGQTGRPAEEDWRERE